MTKRPEGEALTPASLVPVTGGGTRNVDQSALSRALEQLRDLPFPGHPGDPDLAEWVLELTELDGHLAGLAVSALAAARSDMTGSDEVASHEARLAALAAVGDDEVIYELCREYIRHLRRIEDLLTGRGR